MTLAIDKVLIRRGAAKTPNMYDTLPADSEWRLAGVWRDRGGAEHVVEVHFGSRDEAEAFAAEELGLSGRWDDPDGDGNYCIVD